MKGSDEAQKASIQSAPVVNFQDENEEDYFLSDRRKQNLDSSQQETLKAFNDDDETRRDPAAELIDSAAPPKTLKQKIGKLKDAQGNNTANQNDKNKKSEKLPKKDLSKVSSNWLKFLEKNKAKSTPEDEQAKEEQKQKNKKSKRLFPFANNLNPPQGSYAG